MRVTILTGLLLACLLAASCTPRADFDSRLSPTVRPYLFDFAGWELNTLRHEVCQRTPDTHGTDEEVRIVLEYFSAVERTRALQKRIEAAASQEKQVDTSALESELKNLGERRRALQDTVEKIIEKQLREALSEQGIFNPMVRYRVRFPPVNFRLEQPPYLLVISPRERIESMREITLRQNLSLEEIQGIEAEADALGVSSLVVELGGLGATYPTFVTDTASLSFTLNTVAEEWLHQYLAFKPLGFLYLLDLIGLSRNYEIATINETVASMASKEIGAAISQKYYSHSGENGQPLQEEEPIFDFNQEMREIRKTVDALLARGEIEQAEEFMEQKRQHLASKGYYIRKLNQAYFAFHGTYADSPTSISPIGVEIRQLRTQSASLKDFLETAAAITSRQNLKNIIR
jgi:hypothetical protein